MFTRDSKYNMKYDNQVTVGIKQRVETALPGDDIQITRKILLKLDLRIVPTAALLFLCSFLDRTNVGNAKTYNLEENLKMTDHQYETGLAVYYVTYIASQIPSNLVLKKVSPKIWLPALAITWGIVTMCLGFVRNYAGFVAVRAILGFTEGGIVPGIVLYFSGIYTRGEMALRLGLFYTAASLRLLARGLTAIGNHGAQARWTWIFIIEGLLTIVVGATAYFILPNSVETASFLRLDERAFAATRLHRDKPSSDEESESEDFSWSEVVRGLLSPTTWLSSAAYFGILSAIYSFSLFLPTILVELGHTANQAQLWSVIPYAVATVLTVTIAIISDRLKLRGIVILFVLIPAIIGYAVIANIGVSHPRVKYGMTFLMASGIYSSIPCILVWNSNNSAGHYKRATTSGLQLAIANCGGFVATFIYPNKDKPQFHKGHTIVLSLLVASWFLVAANVVYCWKVNRDKRKGTYDRYTGCGDDRDPEFIFIL